MKSSLRITAAQINPIVGDLLGNAEKIIESAIYARDQQHSDVVVFPEMALTGYSPEDLLLRPEFINETKKNLKKITSKVKNIYIILGIPIKEKHRLFNASVVIYNGKIIAQGYKHSLPNHGVFDEKRYFSSGSENCVINIKGIKTVIIICWDIWSQGLLLAAKKAGVKLAININASPFDIKKFSRRRKALIQRTKESCIPIVYVNLVGAQDEVVFDGGSMVINAQGKITQRATFFTEELMPINLTTTGNKLTPVPQKLPQSPTTAEIVYQALTLGVKDYVTKNGFEKVVIGVSGGIDSALTLAIACDAFGKDKIDTFYLPSKFSSKLSAKITKEQAKLLGVKLSTIPIELVVKTFTQTIPDKLNNLSLQNLQARVRATILMAFANEAGAILLNTGNKSEMAVGYATLYGDMAGGFCVLKDVPKTLVYELAEYRNKISYAIPNEAIKRAPSAELAKNQKDSDDLPPYPILDKILERYIELSESPKKIIGAGFKKDIVNKIVNLVDKNEYKRRQAPPGIKITTCAFGKERRYPITSRFR